MMPARSPSPNRADMAPRQGQVQDALAVAMGGVDAEGRSPWSLLRALSEDLWLSARSGVRVGPNCRPG